MVIFATALCLILPNAAFGLSCARPNLDETTIKSAVLIFEGIAGPKRSLDRRERTAVRLHAIKGKGGTIKDLRVYRFSVIHGWKGTSTGQNIDILFNSYWGDGFAAGETYLVVNPQQIGKLFWSPLCGHTIDVNHAARFGDLALLEKVIGVGHHVKVRMVDRACQRAADCTIVQTHCGACSCGTPVARGAVGHYEERFKKVCAAISVAERCEMACPRLTPTCTAGYCVASE